MTKKKQDSNRVICSYCGHAITNANFMKVTKDGAYHKDCWLNNFDDETGKEEEDGV